MVSRRRMSALAVTLASLPAGRWDAESPLWLNPAAHRPLRLPKNEPPRWSHAVRQLKHTWLDDHAAGALMQLLTRPARCYELDGAEGGRRIALLGCVRDGTHQLLICIRLRVSLHTRAQAEEWEQFTVTAQDLDHPAARDELVAVAEELTPQSFKARDPDGPPPEALVIGDLSSEQRERLTRRLWAHGVRAKRVLEQPYRSPKYSCRAVNRFDGALLVLVQEGCGVVYSNLLAANRPPTLPVLLAHTDPDLWPVELDEQLDEAGVDHPLAQATEPAPPEASERAPAASSVPPSDDNAFRRAVRDAWTDALPPDERETYPLRGYRLGPQFLRSLAALPLRDQGRVPWVCAMVVCGRAHEIRGLQVHQMRTTAGGSDSQRVRASDRAGAWRASIRSNTPAAARLHWWSMSNGEIELANAVRHDEFQIPE
jgi:hypothetical protein